MSKPKQTGNNKPVQPKPQVAPTTQPAPPPPPSVDRRLIGTEQRSNDGEISRKVVGPPEKK